MKSMMEKLLDETINKIKKKFHIKPKRNVKSIIFTEEYIQVGWRRHFIRLNTDGELLIFRPFLKSTFFYEYFVSEVSKIFYPENLISVERAIDFGYYIAYKLSKQKKKWFLKWSKLSRPIHYRNITYSPIYDLKEIDAITDGKAIKKIFKFFEELNKFNSTLTHRDYLFYYDALQKEITARLSEKEFELLKKITKITEPIIDINQLPKLTNLPPSDFKTRIHKLKRHVSLTFLPFINWPRINLEFFMVLVEPDNISIEELKTKFMKPYTRVIHQVGGGEGLKLIVTCTLPRGTSYVLEKYLKELLINNYIKSYDIMRPTGYLHTLNFDAFNIKDGTWGLGDEIIEEYVRESKLMKKFPHLNELIFHYPTKKYEISKVEIQVLFEIGKPPGIETSAKILSKKIKAPYTTIVKTLETLKNGQFFKAYPLIYPSLMGLTETLILIIKNEDQETQKRIFHLFNKLPSTYLLRLSAEYGVFTIISVPNKMNCMLRTLNRLLFKYFRNVTEVGSFFEQATFQTKHLNASLFVDGDWVDPEEYWHLD